MLTILYNIRLHILNSNEMIDRTGMYIKPPPVSLIISRSFLDYTAKTIYNNLNKDAKGFVKI